MPAGCPRPLDCADTYGHLQVDGWSLHVGAWCAWDLSALYAAPEVKGPNVPDDGGHGTHARPLKSAQTDYDLPMVISGAVDRAGTPYTDPAAGLLGNRQALYDRLVDPIRSGVASLPAVLSVPEPDGLQDYLFDVQPVALDWTLLPNGYARAVLTLRVPKPVFTPSS